MAKWTSKSHRVKTEPLRIRSLCSSAFPIRSRPAGTKKYIRAHEEIINNEQWYGDEAPSLGDPFTAKKTAERHHDVVQILGRAARRAAKAGSKELARAYDALADKLDACRPRRRCGSLACPRCARAFQKAKFVAQRRLIKKLAKDRPGKQLVMANVIPLWMTFRPDQLAQLDIGKRNRWLKDALAAAGFSRVMFGSADMSWEQGYYQLHWHIGMWTSNRKQPPTPADREAAVEPWSGRARSPLLTIASSPVRPHVTHAGVCDRAAPRAVFIGKRPSMATAGAADFVFNLARVRGAP
jgi:hypothetical protein